MLLKGGFSNTEWDSAVYSIAISVAIVSDLFYADIGKDTFLVAEAINMLGRALWLFFQMLVSIHRKIYSKLWS